MTSDYSVIIPAYNAEQTLAACIESVLAQTVAPSAVIVVDDGSSDGTSEVARAYAPQVTVLHQANTGPGSATTHGLEATTTPILAFNDADDIWLKHKAATQLEWLERNPEVHAVFGRVSVFRHNEAPPVEAVLQDNWGRTTMMIRRAAALRIGPVLDCPEYCGDMIDWLARARELNVRLELLPHVLALRRTIPGSLSHDRRARGKGYLHAAKLALERRRTKIS